VKLTISSKLHKDILLHHYRYFISLCDKSSLLL